MRSEGASEDQRAPYPNRLREIRETEKSWTRDALRSICEQLCRENAAIYTTVSLTTLRTLEIGMSRPQLKTAATLAKALDKLPSEVFPLGVDDPRRNPKGNTIVAPDRKKGGRPKKISNG